jgi:LPXTG-motif cell wall-anchored protein
VGANDPGLKELKGVVGKVMKVSFFDNAALQGEKVTSVTSDENGKAVFYGLAYGKYFLVETESPPGYNTLLQAVELTVDQTSHQQEHTVTVKNESGVVLPSTGGMGTTLFTVGGIFLMCAAGCLLCIKKRRSVQE